MKKLRKHLEIWDYVEHGENGRRTEIRVSFYYQIGVHGNLRSMLRNSSFEWFAIRDYK